MDTLSYKTIFSNKASIEKKWLIVDASQAVTGRLASQIARLLIGKHKVDYTPNIDCGDNVIIINADKIRFTGKKWNEKVYVRHTGYPGGQRFATPRQIVDKRGYAALVEKTVKGMLPKNRLGRQIFKHLFVYEGIQHPHEAQTPQPYQVTL